MLELVTLSCTVMSQRKYTDSALGESGDRSKSRNRIHKSSHHHDVREHKYGRNSAEDPAISSTKSDKHLSTNARTHPRAELKASDHTHSHRSKHVSSNHIHNHVSPKSHDSNEKSRSEPVTPNRKRSHDNVDEDVWTEHTSSSGRVYYYNKRLDKSQWERPAGFSVKKAKTETTPDSASSASGARKTASTPVLTPSSSKHPSYSHSHSHSHSSHHHKDYGRLPSHRGHHHGGSHTHQAHDRKERHESSHHSSSRHGSGSRSHSRSTSPVGAGKSDRGKYSRGHSHTHSSGRGGGHERSKERDASGRHSKSEHTTPTGRAHTTVSPCTPVITSSGVTQTTLVSPSTPHSSTPYSSLTNTTPINSTPVAVLSTPHGSFVQHAQDQVLTASHIQQQTRHKLPFTPQQQTSNGLYVPDASVGGVGGVAISYVGVGGSNVSSPQPVAMGAIDATGLHPLQKALLIQNQVQQNYAVMESSLPMAPVAQAIPQHMTQQQSLPSSPLVQSPMPIPQHGAGTQIIYGTPAAIQTAQPLTQVQYTIAGAAPHTTFDPGLNVTGNFMTLNSPSLRTRMSRLGYQVADSTQFPDPTKLEPVPTSQVNMELFARGLTEPWNQYNNQVQQQIESCQLESLQRRTTETIFLSSKLARSWLRLETSQVSVTSKDHRLSGLRSLIEDLSKT